MKSPSHGERGRAYQQRLLCSRRAGRAGNTGRDSGWQCSQALFQRTRHTLCCGRSLRGNSPMQVTVGMLSSRQRSSSHGQL